MSFKKYIAGFAMSILLLAGVPEAAAASGIQNETIYRILVDRFNNGTPANDGDANVNDPNDFHGGDLKGVTNKLDLIESLGMTTIILSPIMKNAKRGYHGYWTEDFTKIDPHFGNKQDWKDLVEKAHKKNIKVILEFAPSYIAKSNAIAKDPKKSIWFKAETPKGREKWKDQTFALDLDNPEAAQMLKMAGGQWIEDGADGFLIHDASSVSQKFLKEFAREMKKKKPESYILADNTSGAGKTLKDLPGIDAVLDESVSRQFDQSFGKLSGHLPDKAFKENTILHIDGPEQERFGQIAGENGRNAATAWRLALAYMYTAPGVPMIFQGSELPMYGKKLSEVQQLVNFNSGDPDLKEDFERLGALRKQFKVLQTGKFELISNKDSMYVFKRWDEKDIIYVAINNDKRSHAAVIKDLEEGRQLKGLIGDNLVRADENSDYTLTLPRETAEIYVVSEDKGINWALIIFIIGVMVVFVGAIIILSRKQKRHAS
ncbi:alpha-amylase family glycosyl hydrolase [Aciduricibacillus chroicocephali]|uniref:Alpha-amylase family glycosyl hydrolase n=1 Tax=Aciduricibacillus chroicocephali TaxID=3054939 RepID=A0ABY9KXI6_9BACI|nr:alpha-amylase family glycosyl hydrolase [Bacillaceae bacterium 44XB]